MTFKTYQSYHPDFSIKHEEYPYEDSRKLCESLTHWWDHVQRRIKHAKTKSNYDLTSDEKNSLNYSFNEKLKTGNFSFLIYKKTTVAGFQGLLIMDKGETAHCHRMMGNPEFPFADHLGMWTDIFMTWQVKCAYEMGCKRYKLGWNLHNYSRYKSHRDATIKHRFKHNGVNSGLLQKFDYLGKQTLFYTEQYVAELDLTQDWVGDLVKSLEYKLVDE